ncbi:SH3 domain-containing protein [Aggregatilinea lenta]|uniref:SH3 domain-containing protein n=1 Tax=Aggregatilinea lenta TaxID=913108 RepID=UPI000E5BCE21|nr:SH3 domain-containing protein [Aggregatilinea lenta]
MIQLRKMLVLMFIVVLCAAEGGSVWAQSDEPVSYENALFSIQVPGWLSVQEETSTSMVYAGNDATLSVTQFALPDGAAEWLAAAGDAPGVLLANVMQAALPGDVAVSATCADVLGMPCVDFTDMSHSDRVVRQVSLFAPDGMLYVIAFDAPDVDTLALIDPDAVLASFQLLSAEDAPVLVDAEVQFKVTANSSMNVRDCASTTCGVVGQTTAGQMLDVVGEDADWYQIVWEDGTAYVASWLTTRGPDNVVALSEGYIDPATQCWVRLRSTRGDAEFRMAISGESRDDVWADLYRPNDTRPVEVYAQLDNTFVDSDEAYIQQVYWGIWWTTGVYRLELSYNGQTSLIGFEVTDSAKNIIYIDCD